MNVSLSTEFLREKFSSETLTREEVQAIARVAYLTAEIDFFEDDAERRTLDEIGDQLWSIAGLPREPIEPVSPLPIDDEERRWRIRELAAQLMTRRSRELAYVYAYLLVVSDVQLARVEGRFLDDLQRELGISDDRAAELAATSAEHVTPGAAEL